jgi:hypothetical protein
MAFAGDVIDLAILERYPLTTTPYISGSEFYRRLDRRNPPSLLDLLLYRCCFELARALLTQPFEPSSCPIAQSDITSMPCTPTRLGRPDLRAAYDELSLAIRLGRTDLVPMLFYDGFDVNMEAGRWGRPICFAVSRDHYEVVQILSSHGARVDTVETKNILHIAAEHARKEMLQFLLDEGVDVNGTDDRSRTALHLILQRSSYSDHDDATIAEILVKAGADIEAADCHGRTVLIKAAALQRTRLVQFLLGKGANVQARDHQHLTALHVATGMGMNHPLWVTLRSDTQMFGVLQALLDAGADINAECGSQNTMLTTACLGKHYRLMSFLVERGAVLPGSGPWEEPVPLVLEEARRHACDSQPESPASETWSIDAQVCF